MSLLMEALNRAESANKVNAGEDEHVIRLVGNTNPQSTAALEAVEAVEAPKSSAVALQSSLGALEFTSVVIKASAQEPDAPDVNQDRESAKKLVHASNKRYGRSYKTVIVAITSLVMVTLASALIVLEQRAAPKLMSATEIVPNTNIPNTNIVAVTEMPFPDSATTGGAVISDGIPPGEIINNTAIISNTNEAITEVTEPFFASAMTELSISAVDAEPAITAAVSEPAITAAVSESAIAVAEPSNGVVVASAQQNAPDTQAVQPVNKTTDITIIRSTDAQTTRQIAERATLLINARQYPQAAALLEQILTLQPSSMQALILYGSLQLNLGNQSSASEIFSRVISIDPSNVSARVGFLKSIPGYSAEDLISELSRLQQTSPDNHLLAFELGRAFATQSRWTEAARSFSRALELAGRSTANNQVLPEYAFNLAVSLDRSGERMLATRYYNEALDRSGSLPTGFDPEVVKQRVNVLSGR